MFQDFLRNLNCAGGKFLPASIRYGMIVGSNGEISFSLPDGKIIPYGPDTRFRGNVLAIKTANAKNGLDITPKTSIPGV